MTSSKSVLGVEQNRIEDGIPRILMDRIPRKIPDRSRILILISASLEAARYVVERRLVKSVSSVRSTHGIW